MPQTNQLLPIGSIVLLKGGRKRLMVFGVMQNDGENTDKVFDYIGVIYPEGNIGLKSQFLFNHSDIEEVYYRGYDDIERQEFIKNLEKVLNHGAKTELIDL